MTQAPRWPYADFAAAAHAGAVVGFQEEHRFLSNFVGSVEMYGLTFRCPEIAFSAAKIALPKGNALLWLETFRNLLGNAAPVNRDPKRSWLPVLCEQFNIPTPGGEDHARALHVARILMSKIAKPQDAKRIGRKVALRSDWESVRPDGLLEKEWVLLTLNRRKYARDPALARKLLATDDRLLLEANAWGDSIWGVVETSGGVQGFNRMGAIPMAIRAEMGGADVPSSAIAAMPRYAGRGLA